MKIRKYADFINEEIINDTPESYIEITLRQIKKKIDKMFDFQEGDNIESSEQEESNKEEKSIKRAKT